MELTVLPNLLAQSEETYSYASFCADMDRHLRVLECYDAQTMEGAGSLLYSTFVAISDSLLKLANTFKTNMFRFNKDFKRSELRYYFDSNALKCRTANRASFTKVFKVNACVPMGFQGVYLEGIDKILNTYRATDLRNLSDTAQTVLTKILVQITRNSGEEMMTELIPFVRAVQVREELSRKALKQQDKFFTKERNTESPFGTTHPSIDKFKHCSETLLDMEKYLQDVHNLYSQLDANNKVLNDIADAIVKNKAEIGKEFVTGISNATKFLAGLYDIYGQCAIRQAAMEHNQAYTIERVYAEVMR